LEKRKGKKAFAFLIGMAAVVKAILPLIDHLEKALEHSEKTQDIRSLVEGVKLTCDQVLRALKTFGLSPVQSLGSPFDPAVHEAMLVAETDQVEPNQVVEEFRKGYLLHDRLIRATIVSVSKRPQKVQGEGAHSFVAEEG
jgi:molecular chaperone GrpE